MRNKKGYIIFSVKKLIVEYYRGKFNVDELIDFKKFICTDKNYDPCYNVIHDFRDAEFLFGINEISKYVKYTLEVRSNYGIRKSVMITESPNQVVTSMGFDRLKKELPVIVKVTSTLDAAMIFVKLPLNEKDKVEDWLQSQKQSI